MTDRPNVDPRFDPMFQRGYDGAIEPAPAQVPQPVSAQPATPPFESRASALDARVMPSDPVVTTEFAGDTADEPPPSRLNPFIVLLWLIGPLLAVGGAVVTYQAFVDSFTGQRQGDPVMHQFLWVLAPSAVTVGLAIIAGLLFWHAAAFRRARS